MRLLIAVALVGLLAAQGYGQQATSASASISPSSVEAGALSQRFSYEIVLEGGTADRFAIFNPFSQKSMLVTAVFVDGHMRPISNQTTRPVKGNVTWAYDDQMNALVVQTDTSAVKDSIRIIFFQNAPTKARETNEFSSTIDDASDLAGPSRADNSGWNVTIQAGALAKIRIEDSPYGKGLEIGTETLTTDNTLTLYVVGRDMFDNIINDSILKTARWNVTNYIGSVDPALNSDITVFDPQKVGAGIITATIPDINMRDETGLITVTVGQLAKIRIRDGANNGGSEVGTVQLTTDNSIIFYAAGYDADGNYYGDISARWSKLGEIDDPPPTGSFIEYKPSKAGVLGVIVARSLNPEGFIDRTGTIKVLAGRLHRIMIRDSIMGGGSAIDSLVISADEDIKLYAAGYDSRNNYIEDVNARWRVNGDIGSVSPGISSSTLFLANKTGKGTVIAQTPDNGFKAETGIITVEAGSASSLVVLSGANGTGNVVRAIDMSTDSSITLHAAIFDGNSNYINDVDARWENRDLSNPVPVTGSFITFKPSTVSNSGRITVTYGALSHTIGSIIIRAGRLHHIAIHDAPSGKGNEFDSFMMSADDSLSLYAVGFDANGNYVGDLNVNWSVNGGIGTVNPVFSLSTLFSAKTSGNGLIIAQKDTLSAMLRAKTEVITVTPGALGYILIRDGTNGGGIEVDSILMTTDDGMKLYAAGYDKHGNYISDVDAQWINSDVLNPVPERGEFIEFRPSKVSNNGKIRAESVRPAVSPDSTGTITILAGRLHHIVIRDSTMGGGNVIDSLVLSTDESIILHAAGYDANNNFVRDVNVRWSVNGGIGTVAPGVAISTMFSANKIGNGTIVAQTSDALFKTETGIITVVGGEPVRLTIRDGTNGGGNVINTIDMTSDSSLTLYAASYDADSNYVGDVRVRWTSTNTLDTLPSDSSSTLVFQPSTAPTSGTIRAENRNLSDETGTIRVNVGKLHRIAIHNTAGKTGSPIESLTLSTDDNVTLHALGFDADGNFIGDLNVNWSVNGGIGSLNPIFASSTVFSANIIGNGTVTAQLPPPEGAFKISTGMITVVPGKLAGITIRSAPDNGGAIVDDVTMTTDSSLSLYAAGYDIDGNYIRDVITAWNVIRVGDSQVIDDANGKQFVYTPDSAEVVMIVADSMHAGGSFRDSTGTITVLNVPILAYAQGTLSPRTVTLGMDTAFTASVSNICEFDVILDTRTFLSLVDSSGNALKSHLAREVSLPANPNASVELSFEPALIPFDFNGGTYTPLINAFGTYKNGKKFKQTNIPTQINGLNIAVIKIDSIFISSNQILQGDSVHIAMSATNTGGVPISITNVSLTFEGITGEQRIARTDSLNQIEPGQKQRFTYWVTLARNESPGIVAVDGHISGMADGVQVNDSNASHPDTLLVMSYPNITLAPDSLRPRRVTQGQDEVSFSVSINNDLLATGLTLNTDSTSLSFRDGTTNIKAALALEQTVLGTGGTTRLLFEKVNIPENMQAQAYPISLKYAGITSLGRKHFGGQIDLDAGAILVQTPVDLVVIDGTNDPDTVTQGQQVSFRVRVLNRGQASAVLNSDETKIAFGNDPLKYIAELTGNPVIPGEDTARIVFDTLAIDHRMEGPYSLNFNFAGFDSNGKAFVDADSAGHNDLLVQTPPSLVFVRGSLVPSVVTPGQSPEFEIEMRNIGQAGVILDTTSEFTFSHRGIRIFKATLKEPVKIAGAQSANIKLRFHATRIPELINDFIPTVELHGTDSNNWRFFQRDLLVADTLSVYSERGPAIVHLRYLDGGFSGIPDGQINSDDFIKVKFDEAVSTSFKTIAVDSIFALISEGDRFGEGALVFRDSVTAYQEGDADSVLFIRVGNNPILATNSASNRVKVGVGSPAHTIIKAEFSPSLMIIKASIRIGLLKSISGSDAGFPTNRPNLNAQHDSLAILSPESQVFSKYAIIVDDGIPPVVLNFYPENLRSGIRQYISPFTAVKAFVSGRNFVYRSHLSAFLNTLFQNPAITNTLLNDYLALIDTLKNMQPETNNSVITFRDSLQNYSIMSRSTTDENDSIMINPLAQMFTNVTNSIGYAYAPDLSQSPPEQFQSVPNFDDSVEIDTIGESLALFRPGFNVTIQNSTPIASLISDSIAHVWLNIESVLDSHNDMYDFSFSVDNAAEGLKSKDGFTIRTAPNPFKPGKDDIVIEYELPANFNDPEIMIIDSGGRLVRKWQSSLLGQTSGLHRLRSRWDGRNQEGIIVSPGVYLCYLRANNEIKAVWCMAAL